MALSPLDSDNEHILLDFKELAKDGSNYLGIHAGVYENPDMAGHLADASGNKQRSTKIDYAFANQPYSTYGILYDGDNAELFYQSLYAGMSEPASVIEYVVQDRRANYLDSVKGIATYNGDVIATVVRKDGYSDTGPVSPFVDGKVTLTVDLGGSKHSPITDSSIQGYIESNTLGKINLYEGDVYKIANAFNGKAVSGDFSGEYSGILAGKDLNDAVGRINLDNNDALKDGDIKEYHAVFGGTKQ
ncbi:hypothetical protein A1D22_03800 [Pasteurellaceae bacterium LFhippo2]|nr:hypothetical protein [Pasteurellaceae bacterium LFhippo2]